MDVFYVVIGFVLLGIGIMLGAELHHYDTLEQEIKKLKDQLAKRRHTYATADGLDDATAVLVEIVLRHKAEKAYDDARLSDLRKILGEVREGPLAYNTERPSNRPEGTEILS